MTEEEDEGDFLTTTSQLCDHGVVIALIASFKRNSSARAESYSNNYYLGKYTRSIQDQNWALILEPVTGALEKWKRIGIARIADELVDRWESRDFTII